MTQVIVDIPDRLFDASESLSLSGTLELSQLTSGPDTYAFAQPLTWNALILNTGDEQLLVTGSVQGTAQAICGRCLDDFELPLTGEIEGYWLLEDPGEDIPEDLAEDEFEGVGDRHEMDLFPFIQAALVLALPFVPLCREDCAGLCPHCGANLNDGPCGCTADEDEGDDAQARNPFAVLRGLEFPDEN